MTEPTLLEVIREQLGELRDDVRALRSRVDVLAERVAGSTGAGHARHHLGLLLISIAGVVTAVIALVVK